MSLRDKQVAAISKILRLNRPDDPEAPDSDTANAQWTVLILDDYTRDLISSVLVVSDLRELGVTLHMNIKSKREPIPHTPAVYLLQPSQQNLDLVAEDLRRNLYDTVYINFASTVSRTLLESFASTLIEDGTSKNIAQIFDNHLSFLCGPTPDIFHLGLPAAYYLLSSAKTTDQELETLLDRVVTGLFSICVTMDQIPQIRCSKDSASADVAKRLASKLRDHYLQRGKRTGTASTSRSLLLIADRAVDLVPGLCHSWIYQSLVADCLNCNNGHVDLITKEGVKRSFDLTEQDFFWMQHAAAPFPEVAEAVGQEWSQYQREADTITRQTVDEPAGLKSAISLLPELTVRKSKIQNHMVLLEELMSAIRGRKLDVFFSIEAELYKNKMSQAQIIEIIKDPEAGEPLDKLRLFMCYYLSIDSREELEIEKFVPLLTACGADVSALQHIKAVRQIEKMGDLSATTTQPEQASFSNIFKDRLKGVGLSVSADAVLAGLQSWRPPNTTRSLAQLCEALMDPSAASKAALSTAQDLLLYDPYISARDLPAQRSGGFTEAVVFIMGGGSMDEAHSIQTIAQRGHGAKKICYGSTGLLSPNEFVAELTKLGKEA